MLCWPRLLYVFVSRELWMPMSAPFDAGRLLGAACSTGAGAGRVTGIEARGAGEGRVTDVEARGAGASGRAAGAGIRRGAAESDMDRPTVATTGWLWGTLWGTL